MNDKLAKEDNTGPSDSIKFAPGTDMKDCCFLVHAHLYDETNNLIEILSATPASIVLHLDAKSDLGRIAKAKSGNPNLCIIEDRIKVSWGDYTQVDATLSLMINARRSFPNCTRYALISGDSLPVVSPISFLNALSDGRSQRLQISELNVARERSSWTKAQFHNADGHHRSWRYFNNVYRSKGKFSNKGNQCRSEMRIDGIDWDEPFDLFPRFFFAPQWWCISSELVDLIISEMSIPRVSAFFSQMEVPDEHFVPTIIGNSDYYSKYRYKKFMMNHWRSPEAKRLCLTSNLMNDAFKRGFLFARKSRVNQCAEVFQKFSSPTGRLSWNQL